MTRTDFDTPARAINAMVDLASTIQTKAQQVQHLVATCEEALNDMCNTTPGAEASRRDASERLSLFLDLCGVMARDIAKLGEQIEVTDFNFRRSALA